VPNRAVTWKLIEENPAKPVPNPGRGCREQRPFESWEQIRSLAGDIDRAGVIQIRRATRTEVEQTKTRLSRRAVPLQAIAIEALEQLPVQADSPLLFPNAHGGPLDFSNFNRRHWKPVQKTSGSSRCATFTTRATPTPPSRSVPACRCSLCPGSWARAMIDLHYGHLAVDSHEHAVLFLDALALERAVDAGWTPARKPATPTASHRAFVAV
jgi:hypothetical protein